MSPPLPSIVALARFTFTQAELDHAAQALMAETDWQEWINQVELHGLSGFVNKHLADYDLPIPNELRLPLKALKTRHTAASEARFEALKQINEVFVKNDIPYLGLKGAALINQAADCLREIGFDLPTEQPSKFMRDMHQLPNATKTVNGFLCSVELHRDGISREVVGHFYYPKSDQHLQQINWDGLSFASLEDVQMLHQVTRHLEGLHSGAVLKLINVMDVIGLASHIEQSGQWSRLEKEYPHVINTLKCLHLLTPLPENLQNAAEPLSNKPVQGVGEIMVSLRSALFSNTNVKKKLNLLLSPSDWWLYLYYNVDPKKSLWWIKAIRHPLRVSNWLLRRIYSGLVGG